MKVIFIQVENFALSPKRHADYTTDYLMKTPVPYYSSPSSTNINMVVNAGCIYGT